MDCITSMWIYVHSGNAHW